MIEVLDGKKLMIPLNLSPEQVATFTTCQPLEWGSVKGFIKISNTLLPVRADVICFEHHTLVVGAS